MPRIRIVDSLRVLTLPRTHQTVRPDSAIPFLSDQDPADRTDGAKCRETYYHGFREHPASVGPAEADLFPDAILRIGSSSELRLLSPHIAAGFGITRILWGSPERDYCLTSVSRRLDFQLLTRASAMSRTLSKIASPLLASCTLVLHGGTTWIRLKLANGSRPLDLHAATSSFITGLEPP